jgi:predicted metal-binding protein
MPLTTARRAVAQLFVCASGCCCGRTDKRKPPVPVDALKATWKTERLLKTVQLTIAGCLGPCDVLNVVAIVTPGGWMWLGGLNEPIHWEALIGWARTCKDTSAVAPLPPLLADLAFDRFPAAPAPSPPTSL